jgi:xylulokinase
MTNRQGGDKLILAVDHGTSGMKLALVTVSGRVKETRFEPVETRHLPDGGAEQDPEHWWSALCRGSQALLAKAHCRGSEVAAVAVTSMFSSTVAVDREGKALANCLTWMDSRGGPHVRRLMGGFPEVKGYNVQKAARWIRVTGGGPSLSGKDDIGHVLYWKHEMPEVYGKAAWFLPSKDYLNLRLTGEVGTSQDSMTLFWVCDTRDPYDIRYDAGLAEAAGIDLSRLPPMYRSAQVLGGLTSSASSGLGLRRGTPVVVGSPDHQTAAIGAGSVLDFDGHLYLGTSSWVQCTVPFRRTDVLHSIASIPTAIPGRYTCANEQDMAGGCLEAVARLVVHANAGRSGAPGPDGGSGEQGPETEPMRNTRSGPLQLIGARAGTRRLRSPSASAPSPDVYARLERLAAETGPGSGGVLFAPWLNGERTPVDDPSLRGALVNFGPGTSAGQLVRAVMEGVAYNTRWSLSHVEKFVGNRLAPLSVVGGGARSDTWCQILADVLGRRLVRPVHPTQANARGASFIAAVALGEIAFQDVPALMETERAFDPSSAVRALHDNGYEAFLRLHSSIGGWFQWRNGGAR